MKWILSVIVSVALLAGGAIFAKCRCDGCGCDSRHAKASSKHSHKANKHARKCGSVESSTTTTTTQGYNPYGGNGVRPLGGMPQASAADVRAGIDQSKYEYGVISCNRRGCTYGWKLIQQPAPLVPVPDKSFEAVAPAPLPDVTPNAIPFNSSDDKSTTKEKTKIKTESKSSSNIKQSEIGSVAANDSLQSLHDSIHFHGRKAWLRNDGIKPAPKLDNWNIVPVGAPAMRTTPVFYDRRTQRLIVRTFRDGQ